MIVIPIKNEKLRRTHTFKYLIPSFMGEISNVAVHWKYVWLCWSYWFWLLHYYNEKLLIILDKYYGINLAQNCFISEQANI